MSDPKLDELLRQFLDDHAEQKRKGVTLERLHDAVANLGNNMVLHERKDEERWDKVDGWMRSTDRRVTHLEADVENLKDKAEDTGQHAIDAIREASEAKGLAAAKRTSPAPPGWPLRKFISPAIKGLVLLTAAALGYVLRHLGLGP